MPVNHPNNWGVWIGGRFFFLGYRRLSNLSTLLGCSYDVVWRWSKLASPPANIRKDFDVRLIEVLKTDRFTLFTGYVSVAPEEAPIIEPRRRGPSSDAMIRRAPTSKVA
jgi:hypothetical protein